MPPNTLTHTHTHTEKHKAAEIQTHADDDDDDTMARRTSETHQWHCCCTADSRGGCGKPGAGFPGLAVRRCRTENVDESS